MTPPAWQQHLDDPDAPLYTLGVVAELLGVDVQVVRRLDRAGIPQASRSSGNQRRFSRNDIASVARAIALQAEGVSRSAIARILELERRLEQASAEGRTTAQP